MSGAGFWNSSPSGGGGSGAAWTQVVDESGSSLANWTSVAGTWAVDAGGYIKQTNAAAAYYALKLSARVTGGAKLVAEAEMRFPTGATAGARAFLGLYSNGTVSGSVDPYAGLQNDATNALYWQRGTAATLAGAFARALDTWYTVRVAIDGPWVTTSIDGVAQRTVNMAGAAGPTLQDAFILATYGGAVHYRNIKAWRLDGPA